jgi:hypothetical protein
MEAVKRVINHSDVLRCLFDKPLDIDAAKLVEESWKNMAKIIPHQTYYLFSVQLTKT